MCHESVNFPSFPKSAKYKKTGRKQTEFILVIVLYVGKCLVAQWLQRMPHDCTVTVSVTVSLLKISLRGNHMHTCFAKYLWK